MTRESQRRGDPLISDTLAVHIVRQRQAGNGVLMMSRQGGVIIDGCVDRHEADGEEETEVREEVDATGLEAKLGSEEVGPVFVGRELEYHVELL